MVKFILRINFVHMWTSENQNRKIYQVFIFLTKYDSYPQVEQVVVTADRSYWSQVYHNEYPLNQALCKVGQYNFANEERFTNAECDTPNMSSLGNLCYRILPISLHLGKTRLQGT